MRSKKILKLFILMIGVFFIGLNGIKADEFTIYAGSTNYQEINCNAYFTNCGLTAIRKITTDGDTVYCAYHETKMPNGGDSRYTWTRTGEAANSKALGYILENGPEGGSTDSEINKNYLITQFALWYYIDNTTFNRYFDYSTRTCKTGSGTNTSANTSAIMSLIDEAESAANKTNNVTVTIEQNSTNLTLSSDKKFYTGSFTAKAVGNDSKITIMFNKSLTGTFLTTNASSTTGNNNISVTSGTTVYIKVPASSVTETSTIKLTARATATVVGADYYESTSTYQPLIKKSTTSTMGSDSKEFTITYTPTINKYPVKISKKSTISTAELKGAVLVIKDSSKKEVDRWPTDGSVHTANLEPGTYTLEEESAPAGYTKSNEVITFVVGTDGKITVNGKVVTSLELKNTPDRIMISKVDSITGKELAGATLVIKDSSGKPVQTITTKGNPEPISLSPGEYTLEETTAPKGYIKNTKVIKFTVTSNNKITIDGKETSYVEMENDPIIIYISKKSINGKTELPGATLVITDKDGNLKEDLDGKSLTWTSTTDITKFHLAPGTYYLYETKAPKGYELSDKKLEFTILEDGTVKMNTKTVDDSIIVFTNTPEPTPVQTGSLLVYIIVIGTIAVGVVTYYVMKQDKLRV